MNYYLFAGQAYYAKGGARDYICKSDDINTLVATGEALIKKEDSKPFPLYIWWHIADDNMAIVYRSENQAHS